MNENWVDSLELRSAMFAVVQNNWNHIVTRLSKIKNQNMTDTEKEIAV